MLCKYRHIFGKENTGIHSIRLFNIAIVDLTLTILAGVWISYFWNIKLYKVL